MLVVGAGLLQFFLSDIFFPFSRDFSTQTLNFLCFCFISELIFCFCFFFLLGFCSRFLCAGFVYERARNFRLHERSHSVNQSDEVSRINQMFRRSISTSVLNRRPESSSRSGGSQSSSSASSPFEEPSARSKLISNVLLVKQLQQHYKRMKSVNDATTTTTASSENNSVNSERKYKCKRCCNKGHKRDHNQNNMIADCDR